MFVTFKLPLPLTDVLVKQLRDVVNQVKERERRILDLATRVAKMPRKDFIKAWEGNQTNLEWVVQEVAGNHAYSSILERHVPAIQEVQQKLIDLQARVILPLGDLKETNKKMNDGELKARKATAP